MLLGSEFDNGDIIEFEVIESGTGDLDSILFVLLTFWLFQLSDERM